MGADDLKKSVAILLRQVLLMPHDFEPNFEQTEVDIKTC